MFHNRAYKTIGLLAVAAVTVCSNALPALAVNSAGKDEVVYVNLTADGERESIYVVNVFDLATAGTITDYGAYSELRNLTTTDPITASDGMVTAPAPAGRFYYQGTLEGGEVPWEVTVRYYLDGQPIEGAALAGKSGALRIELGLHQNPGANPLFLENFALQGTVLLDGEKCKNIQAPDATMANVGANKQLSYIVLPDKEADYVITADVTDFEMDGIQINGIPLSLHIDDPDTDDLMEDIYKLQDGAVDLDDGAGQLEDGVLTLLDGATDLRDGAEELYDGAKDLYKGAQQLQDGAATLSGGAQQLQQGFAALDAGGAELRGGIDTFQTSLMQLMGGRAMTVGLSLGASGDEQDLLVTSGVLLEGRSAPDTATLLAQGLSLAQVIPQAVEALQGQLSGLPAEEQAAIMAQIQLLEQMKKINELCNGVLRYMAGVEQASAGYGQMMEGLPTLVDGVGKLYGGASDLEDGAQELYDGTNDLYDGVNDLYDGTTALKDGTWELYDQTWDMDGTVDERIDEMLDEYRNKDFTMPSFVSEKNQQVDAVQFVIKTAEIKTEEVPAPVEEVEQPGFWQRLLNLFMFWKD